jgi:hypothetical protein
MQPINKKNLGNILPDQTAVQKICYVPRYFRLDIHTQALNSQRLFLKAISLRIQSSLIWTETGQKSVPN